MWWTSEPLHVLCPLPLIFIFADSLLPKPLYHPFSWTYFWNMSEECLAPSITVVPFYECNRAQVVRYHRSMVLQSAAPFSAMTREELSKGKTIAQQYLTCVSDCQLIIELCIADKECDENAACHCFNFMQDCLASWHCIPIIKSLCIVNKDYLRQCALQMLMTDYSDITSNLKQVVWTHLGVCFCLLTCFCWMCDLTPSAGHRWQIQLGSTETIVLLLHLSLPELSVSTGTPVTCTVVEGAAPHWCKRRNKAAQEELDPPGCLSN